MNNFELFASMAYLKRTVKRRQRQFGNATIVPFCRYHSYRSSSASETKIALPLPMMSLVHDPQSLTILTPKNPESQSGEREREAAAEFDSLQAKSVPRKT